MKVSPGGSMHVCCCHAWEGAIAAPAPKLTLLHVFVQIAVRTVRRSASRCAPAGISLGATTAPPASAPATEE